MALASLIALAACSSDGAKKLGAAEPATAPVPSASAAGTAVRVGATPEGIVFDPTTSLVAVAVRKPDRLLLLDPMTLAVQRSLALPGHARHLQLARSGGPVLVPAEDANQLVEVALPGGTKRTFDVGKQPHDAAATSGGEVVTGDEFGGSISVIRDGKVVHTISDLKQPGGVIAEGPHTVAVVDVGAFTLSTYDLTAATRTAITKAGKGPTHGVLITGNRALVADTRGDAVLVFQLSPLKQVGRLPVGGAPYGMADDRTTNTVWVTLTARNQVVGLDVSGNTPKVVARYDTVRQPNTVAVAPGGRRLWVTGTETGVVQLITR